MKRQTQPKIICTISPSKDKKAKQQFVKMQHNATEAWEGVTQETTVAMETASQGGSTSGRRRCAARSPSLYPFCHHCAHDLNHTIIHSFLVFMLLLSLWTKFAKLQHIYSKEYTSDRWDLSQFIWVLFNIGYRQFWIKIHCTKSSTHILW